MSCWQSSLKRTNPKAQIKFDDKMENINVAPILSTKEPEYSPSMGYEHPNTTSETESDEIIKSGVEELHAQPEDSNKLFQKLLEDLQIINKELTECNHPTFFDDNKDHSVQYKEYLENSSNETAASNSNQEKEKPPQDSDIRQLIREECCIQEPSYNQNYNDNYYPHDLPSFPCCDNCGGSHATFQCQQMDQNIDFSGYLMKSIQTFLEEFNYIPFGEKPKILLLAWGKFFAIQHAQPENSNELFQKLLEDLQIINKELIECNHPTFFDNDEDHSVQYKEYLENSNKFP
nr:hypothetical protein [Tanacetum cinerariifolium]